ncbi:hypothetical protein [Salinicola halophilus]|uniref:hypothetical protein n=1 Tax=Salinicola halophilus TaxID=184065 RepID=UPI0013A63C80|nr:hypothetical protein [Salinicola halophilus]
MSLANAAWLVSVVATTIGFAAFFTFSATRRRGLLPTALISVAIAIAASLIAALNQ